MTYLKGITTSLNKKLCNHQPMFPTPQYKQL